MPSSKARNPVTGRFIRLNQPSEATADSFSPLKANNLVQGREVLKKKREISASDDDELGIPRKRPPKPTIGDTLSRPFGNNSSPTYSLLLTDEIEVANQGQENLLATPNSMPHLQSHNLQGQTSADPSRHLRLNFNLISDDGELRHPTRKEAKIILSLFPGSYAVSFSPPMLVIRFREYPPKPWPVSIAGLPAWFTTDDKAEPVQFGFIGRHSGILEKTLPLWGTPSQSFFKELVGIFEQDFGISVLSVLWMGSWFLITIPKQTQSTALPSMISGLLATYRYPDTPSQQLREAVYRTVVPTESVNDRTDYRPILRPGIMVSCGVAGGDEFLTTAGVPVRNRDGRQYVTVATHGFPLGKEIVYHPTGGGSVIGEVQMRFEDSDISLMKLSDDLSFEAETFESAVKPTVTLVGLKDSDDVRIGERVLMDNPFSGRCEGLVGKVEFKRVDPESTDHHFHWVTVVWTYVGNGAGEPEDGSCGSVMWNEDGDVVAMFRYAGENGWALGISPITLIEAGWEVSPIAAKVV